MINMNPGCPQFSEIQEKCSEIYTFSKEIFWGPIEIWYSKIMQIQPALQDVERTTEDGLCK